MREQAWVCQSYPISMMTGLSVLQWRCCCNFSTEQILRLLSQFTISHVLTGCVWNQWGPVQSSLGAIIKYLAPGVEVKPIESGESLSSSAEFQHLSVA